MPSDLSFAYIEGQMNCDAEHKLKEMLKMWMKEADNSLLNCANGTRKSNTCPKDELWQSNLW